MSAEKAVVVQTTESCRIGIVSDTHGSIDPRIAESVVDCDKVLHAGDIMSASVLNQIRPENGELYSVLGNNDVMRTWPEDAHAVLAGIPETVCLDLPGGRLCMIHGHQIWGKADRHAALRSLFPDARAIVYGHSHLRTYCDEKTPWLLNPGAAGKVRNHGGPSCMILRASAQTWDLDFLRFSADEASVDPIVKTWRLENSCAA